MHTVQSKQPNQKLPTQLAGFSCVYPSKQLQTKLPIVLTHVVLAVQSFAPTVAHSSTSANIEYSNRRGEGRIKIPEQLSKETRL